MPPAKAGASAAQARERRAGLLTELLEPLVADAGYDLEDVAVSTAGRRSLVRVIVDADGGIDLDAVAEVSHVVSRALDDRDDLLPGSYVLEVSSPGVDRPLSEPRHWRRATGRRVSVPVGEQSLSGRITAVDDAGVTLDVDGTARSVAWPELGRGKVQVEFTRPEEG